MGENEERAEGTDGMTRKEREDTFQRLRRPSQKGALGNDVDRLLPTEDRTTPDTVAREGVRERSIRRRGGQ